MKGSFSDLMWSDPWDDEGWAKSDRGAGHFFGPNIVKDFNFRNGLELIARAHQMVMEGYQFWFSPKNLVTIWSAPNYCYRCGNMASIMKVTDQLSK